MLASGINTISSQQVDSALGGGEIAPQLATGTQGSFKAARELLESSTQKLAADVAGALDFDRA